MGKDIKVKDNITIKEFIELLKTIENQDKVLVVPDWENYGCDPIDHLTEYENSVVIN